MNTRLLQTAIATETDVVAVRKRTRRLAELIGFDRQDQTRITTAVSEIVRNAFEYAGGGQIEYRLAGDEKEQVFTITVRDRGPGIANLQAVLAGAHKSATGMGVGLLGAQRLMDSFDVASKPGGTKVQLGKNLPRHARLLTSDTLKRVMDELAADGPADAIEEITRQNQQILLQMDELQSRHEDLERLNQELQDTNRGVVALYAELDERADHLRRADELKSKFLSHMSHEFRTPLNSILALSKLLLVRADGELTMEQETQVRFIRKAAENLTELVDDLLDLAKVEAGKTVVVATPFTASSLFGALRGMLRPLLLGDGVALVFDEPVDLPALDTDEAKVSQILRNFISNAIKFTERGEVRVWATADTQADTVSFHVRDTGIGIAPGDVELLGGRIDVASVPGEGSTFSVTVPRVHLAAEPPELMPEWIMEPGKLPILLVEDDEADAHAIERSLATSLYQPLRARGVREASQILQTVTPAAIILDVVLAGDESWRLILQLRNQDSSAEIPLIVSSSTGDDRKAMHLGADDYIAKPVDGERLIDALDRVTGQRSLTKVLLVDDEEVTHYLVRQLLPRGRYGISISNNGRDGFDRLIELKPDVVLLDLRMPGMDGYTFLDRMSSYPTLANLPAIVLTSTILTDADRTRLSRAVLVMSKSELSSGSLVDAITRAQRACESIGVA
jgi:signal transduction histidine kinase/CheY-like chemotaxis protein